MPRRLRPVRLRGAKEHVAWVDLEEGVYHDLVLVYREAEGAAAVQVSLANIMSRRIRQDSELTASST